MESQIKYPRNEFMTQQWSVRTLRRQTNYDLFMRIAQSQNNKSMLELAKRLQIIRTPQNVIKDTFLLDFLGIPKEKQYTDLRYDCFLISLPYIFANNSNRT